MRLLIADDSQIIRKLLEFTLKGTGSYEIVWASTGDEALSIMQSTNPPLIAILDWQMPGVTGLEICRQVRAVKSLHRPVIIIISSSSGEQDLIDTSNAGADEFIPKPISRGLLVSRVQAAVKVIAHQDMLIERYRRIEQQMELEREHQEAKLQPQTKPSDTGGSLPARPFPNFPSQDQIRALVDRTLKVMGLGEAISNAKPQEIEAMQAEVAAVHFMILHETALWLDLVLETTHAASVVLFGSYAGISNPPPSAAEAADIAPETLNMIQASIKSELRAKGCEPLSPLVPQLLPSNLVEIKTSLKHVYCRSLHRVKGVTLRFTLFVHPAPVKNKTLRQVSLADVMAKDLNLEKGSEVVLLKRGAFIDGHALAKIENMAASDSQNMSIPVFESTQLIKLLADV